MDPGGLMNSTRNMVVTLAHDFAATWQWSLELRIAVFIIMLQVSAMVFVTHLIRRPG